MQQKCKKRRAFHTCCLFGESTFANRFVEGFPAQFCCLFGSLYNERFGRNPFLWLTKPKISWDDQKVAYLRVSSVQEAIIVLPSRSTTNLEKTAMNVLCRQSFKRFMLVSHFWIYQKQTWTLWTSQWAERVGLNLSIRLVSKKVSFQRCHSNQMGTEMNGSLSSKLYTAAWGSGAESIHFERPGGSVYL